MALRMGALYDALTKAHGLTPDDARGAAEEVANYENRIARVESSLETVKWMVGANITITLLALASTLAVLYRMAGQ